MTANERPKLGAVLLAAGGSSRLGRPKQLLKIDGETLLRRAARSLGDSVFFPVVAVLGAEADSMAAELAGLPVYCVSNDQWSEGMASSIRRGVGELLEIEPEIDGVLLSLCDQPLITAEMFNRFAAKYPETDAPVIAAAYEDAVGVPALFGKSMFDDLLALDGEKGARRIIRGRPDTATIDLPEAAADIDTMNDVVRFGITNSEK